MSTTAAPHAARRALLLAAVLAAVLASSSKCDVGCEVPGPDGDWRHAAEQATT
jgi:hypothetical protein